ncbi:MAG: ribosome biogenesis GTPase YlqF [Myxococcales bacterium]|nr:ribosome biogenesis GTPase YlqF [Myxococcales bacterium]
MAIQWYPGHMAKARRAIAEAVPTCDVVIEVLDARMPRSSENPVLGELRGQKPCLKVLSKSDLADPEITRAWLSALAKPAGPRSAEVAALAITTQKNGDTLSRVPAACARLATRPNLDKRPVRALVVGIPNVGKSTLVNTLMGRKVAEVGDEPAVTKSVQRVILKSGVVISDVPGILWPKIEDEGSSLRLALGGAIPETALEFETIALFACAFLSERYPDLLKSRYKLTELGPPDELLVAIGKKRGALRAGGKVDLNKAAHTVVTDFRSGAIGRISLERPEDFAARDTTWEEPSAAPGRTTDDDGEQ